MKDKLLDTVFFIFASLLYFYIFFSITCSYLLVTIALYPVFIAVIYLIFFKFTKRKTRINLSISCLSILLTLMFSDVLIYTDVIQIGSKLDLPFIPKQKRLYTAENYLTATLESNYSASVYSPGQVAAYIQDEDIFERRRIEVKTDHLGFRNPKNINLDSIDIIIGGDSYAFGYATTQNKICSEVIRSKTTQNVYNIGVYGTSPSQEVELLNHLLKNKLIGLSNKPTFIFLLFEGNDFTDANVYLDNSFLAKVKREVYYYFSRSFIRLVRSVAVNLYSSQKEKTPPAFRIHTSHIFKKTAFSTEYTNRIIENNQSADTAWHVFNNSGFTKSIERLNHLCKKFNAKGMIVYVPTKLRIYNRYFKAFSDIPEDRLKKYAKLATEKLSLDFLDITPFFEKAAKEQKMIYWRDDSHINDLGHQILSLEILKKINLEG